MPGRKTLIFAVVIFLLVSFNLGRIYAYFWKAENATVRLMKCPLSEEKECIYTGTLRRDPLSGDYILKLSDGNEVRFLKDDFLEITLYR